jgi:hypothetical protein
MRVLCNRIASPTTGEDLETSAWLSVGREYDVLEVVAYPEGEVLLRLLGDDPSGGPGLWDSRLFTTKSTAMPADWAATVDDAGALHLGPAKWQRDGFWEAFFDGDPDAIRDYDDVLKARPTG